MANDNELLQQLMNWKSRHEIVMGQYWNRWAKNLDLVSGRFDADELNKSKVRGRSKIFFRKIWAAKWRFKAAMHQLFLKDPLSFKIEGRGEEDVLKASLLQKLVEYRRDWLFRNQNLLVQFDWALDDIFDLGCCFAKMGWRYENGLDHPEFILYPPEQVILDMKPLPWQRRYVMFINYLNKDEVESMGLEIDDCSPTHPQFNAVRNARYRGNVDPMQNPGDNEYPMPGSVTGGETDEEATPQPDTYEVWECFYWTQDGVKRVITCGDQKILKDAEPSPYGNRLPVVDGICLTQPHKWIGEGFPEALEGPQESLNAILNMRKDNLALLLNRHRLVDRFGNVDLQSLVNARTGGITLADDINAVKELDMTDNTQGAYMEAMQDERMMEEMSGITDIIAGQGKESKATVAQINYNQASAKIDYYGAIIGETLFKNFYANLADLILRFETDEKILRVCNKRLNEDIPGAGEVDLDESLDYDCIISIGQNTVSKGLETQQTLLAMDRAIQANAAALQVAQLGMPARFIDVTKFFEKLLPQIGFKNVKEFMYEIQGQPQQPEPKGQEAQEEPTLQLPNETNFLQGGGLGGI